MLEDLDLVSMKRKLASHRNNLSSLKVKHGQGLVTNREREFIMTRLDKAKYLRDATENYIHVLGVLQARFIKENLDFKNRRLDFVSGLVTNNVAHIFPTEGYRVKIKADFKHRSNKTKLQLIDRRGRIKKPHINEGKLLQEIISFSGALGVTESYNKKTLYMDEAFAASDPNNLVKIAELLALCVDRGFQVIMVEQHPEIYKNLPRREHHIRKNPLTELTSLVEVLDY